MFGLIGYNEYKKRQDERGQKLIVSAMKKLKTLSRCPDCNGGIKDHVMGTHQNGMEIDLIFCKHPYHSLDYEDNSFTMLSIGLPNHDNFDKGWVSEMQISALTYAKKEKLSI